MLNKRAYKKDFKIKNAKPFQRMSDSELVELYYILINTQYKKNDNCLKALNKFLLQTGKIELFK